jgi:hypothetical protein
VLGNSTTKINLGKGVSLFPFHKVCHKCHKKGHIKKNCPKLKNVSSTCFEYCYILSHNAKGVHAKFVGTSIVGNKKKAIWVPKT